MKGKLNDREETIKAFANRMGFMAPLTHKNKRRSDSSSSSETSPQKQPRVMMDTPPTSLPLKDENNEDDVQEAVNIALQQEANVAAQDKATQTPNFNSVEPISFLEKSAKEAESIRLKNASLLKLNDLKQTGFIATAAVQKKTMYCFAGNGISRTQPATQQKESNVGNW